MFIDTHLHLSYNEGVCPDEFIKNAIDANVNYLIVSCCSKESIIEGLDLVKKFDCVFLSIGFHPEYVNTVTDEDLKWLENIIKNKGNNRIVAIGEIGLDYHYTSLYKDAQIELFSKQLDLAKKFNLPVVIHTRDAIEDTYRVLSGYSLKGVIHCYSGSKEMALKFIKLGYYLGIGGVLTFTNSKIYKVVEQIGLDHLVLETDSPYLSPYRGEINESKNIPIIAQKLADILSISISDVASVTTKNAISLFDLDI